MSRKGYPGLDFNPVEAGKGPSVLLSLVLSEPAIENLQRGNLIYYVLLLPGGLAGLTQFVGSTGGSQAFITVFDWDGGDFPGEFIPESAGPEGCFTLITIKPQGQSEDNQPDLPFLYDLCDSLERLDPSGMNGFHRMGCNTQFIGGGEPDPGLAVIDGENGMFGHGRRNQRVGRARRVRHRQAVLSIMDPGP